MVIYINYPQNDGDPQIENGKLFSSFRHGYSCCCLPNASPDSKPADPGSFELGHPTRWPFGELSKSQSLRGSNLHFGAKLRNTRRFFRFWKQEKLETHKLETRKIGTKKVGNKKMEPKPMEPKFEIGNKSLPLCCAFAHHIL